MNKTPQEQSEALTNKAAREYYCYLCELTALDWCIAFARTAKIWNYKT